MNINHFSRVVPGKKNLSPIVLNISESLNKDFDGINSTINSKYGDVNIYHFGGIWNLINFFRYQKYASLNILFLHGTDIHNYTKDLSIINKLKSILNFFSNYVLMEMCCEICLVSNSLYKFIPHRHKNKVHVLNLGIDLEKLHSIKKNMLTKNSVAFINNNNRKIKNKPLAKKFCAKSKLDFQELGGLTYSNFLAKLSTFENIIITSFQEGSPNTLKESIFFGLNPFVVDVGDCKDLIERFGGTLIDYDANKVQVFSKKNRYEKDTYLSIKKTSSHLLIIIQNKINRS